MGGGETHLYSRHGAERVREQPTVHLVRLPVVLCLSSLLTWNSLHVSDWSSLHWGVGNGECGVYIRMPIAMYQLHCWSASRKYGNRLLLYGQEVISEQVWGWLVDQVAPERGEQRRRLAARGWPVHAHVPHDALRRPPRALHLGGVGEDHGVEVTPRLARSWV